jgi:hypothetical protein
MANPQLYLWDFDRSQWDNRPEATTFSVGIYQWISNASGTGLKKSKTIRVLGYVAAPGSVYAKAEDLCHRFNKERVRFDALPAWVHKQYSLPEPSRSPRRGSKKATAKERVTELARDGLGSHLKALGFLRKERIFWRDSAEVCHVIALPMSRWGTKYVSSFDVFLGVFWHDVEKILRNPSVGRMPPPEYRCTFRVDLGWLTPSRLQKSWYVDETTDLKQLGKQVLANLTRYGLPWLDYRSQLKNALDCSRYLRSMGRGRYTTHELLSADGKVVFLTMLGRLREAKAAMKRRQANGTWDASHAKLARRLGIDV